VTVRSGSPFEDRYGFVRARRVGERVLVSGTAPIPPPGDGSDAYGQMLRCGEIILEALAELGAAVDDVVRTRMYISDRSVADEVGRAHREVFGSAEPVATMVVAGLLDPAWLVEVAVEAVLDRDS
jgi:enamine deaminase RidA (YjgF/YER057c/UK114 family)